jgi:hypothetical protein
VKQRAIIILLLSLIVAIRAGASDRRDYLIRGEREKDTYDRAIRRILRQGWQKDIVLRYVHIPPFEKELVIGIRRVGADYRAFVLEPSSHIWTEEVKRLERKRPDFSHIQAVYKERPISHTYVRQAAAFWRYVLSDPRNYHEDTDSYLDSSQLYFFLGLLPQEHLAAHAVKLGPKSEELMHVASDLSAFVYPAKADEAKMFEWLRQSEKKVGFRSSVDSHDTSNEAMRPIAGRRTASLFHD